MSASIDVPHIKHKEVNPSARRGLASRALSLFGRNTQLVKSRRVYELSAEPSLLEISREEIDELFDRIKAAQDELRALKPGDKREKELSDLITKLQERDKQLFKKLRQASRPREDAE